MPSAALAMKLSRRAGVEDAVVDRAAGGMVPGRLNTSCRVPNGGCRFSASAAAHGRGRSVRHGEDGVGGTRAPEEDVARVDQREVAVRRRGAELDHRRGGCRQASGCLASVQPANSATRCTKCDDAITRLGRHRAKSRRSRSATTSASPSASRNCAQPSLGEGVVARYASTLLSRFSMLLARSTLMTVAIPSPVEDLHARVDRAVRRRGRQRQPSLPQAVGRRRSAPRCGRRG